MSNLVKTKQMRYRIDAQKAKLYEATLKEHGINPKDDYDRYISEVIRTKGISARELYGKELQMQADQILAQVKIDKINLHEAFTEAMVNEVIRIMNPKSAEGVVRMLTYDSVMYFIKDISEKHHVPPTSVLTCMRQNVHDLYMDNRGELNRLLTLFETIQEDAMELSK